MSTPEHGENAPSRPPFSTELEASCLRDRWTSWIHSIEKVRETEQRWVGVLLLVFGALFLFVLSNAYPIETTTYALTAPDLRRNTNVLLYVIVENLIFVTAFSNLFSWTWMLHSLMLRKQHFSLLRSSFVESHRLQKLYDKDAPECLWDTLPETWKRFMPNLQISRSNTQKWQYEKELIANKIIWKDWRSHASNYNESKLTEFILLAVLLFTLGCVAIIKLVEALQVSIGFTTCTAVIVSIFFFNLTTSILWVTKLYAYYDKRMLKDVFSWTIKEYTNRYWKDADAR